LNSGLKILTGFLKIALLMFFYGCIWLVPASISHNRKKKGLPTYWLLLLLTLVIEIVIVYACLYSLNSYRKELLLAFLPPIIASVFAGFFYFHMAKKFDAKYS